MGLADMDVREAVRLPLPCPVWEPCKRRHGSRKTRLAREEQETSMSPPSDQTILPVAMRLPYLPNDL
ncbi:hypothetical protein NDU88_004894 [Pleurodeles waltl]|uniref:Uncharacterized protein n=1 Tax=Pleurodeles waltl TaxID=8319 RepID=A0AAV7L7Z0_PLEWA|nr:hypothetical protein NDU88_004894 [Pleurodeles waltl]